MFNREHQCIESALKVAARKGHYEKVARLLEKNPEANVNASREVCAAAHG